MLSYQEKTSVKTGPPVFQPKLKIGQPGDKYEREADAVADRVMRMSEGETMRMQPLEEEEEMMQMQPLGNGNDHIQMKCAACEKEEMLQPKSETGGGYASSFISQHIQNSIGNGKTLPSDTNQFISNAFGTDFSGVRIHNDSNAWQMNRMLQAKAFTNNNHIYFNQGLYSPFSKEGKRLLAHEPTHTIHQNDDNSIQRTCSDGVCADCEGGMKSLWVTTFFRRRATAETMRILREKINAAKNILKECCINLYFDFNWTLLEGNRDFDPGTARPAGSAQGAWDYPEDAETLGEGITFSGARGIPMLIVDNIPRTGGGVTVSEDYATDYESNPYIVLPIEHGKNRAIAHELGHVAGILSHSTRPNVMDSGVSTNVYPEYCTAMRDLADA